MLKINVNNQDIIIDLNCKKGYRLSPKPNERALLLKKLAKNKTLHERKKLFSMSYSDLKKVN